MLIFTLGGAMLGLYSAEILEFFAVHDKFGASLSGMSVWLRIVAVTSLGLLAAAVCRAAWARFLRRRSDRSSQARVKGPQALLPGAVSSSMALADRQFLPAAIEIMESPPSPIRIAFLWFICLAVVVTLAWSYFGKLDIHAVAQGKIQPSGRSKVVQPFEPGKVIAVLVENGSQVNAGDLLLELDSTETAAEQQLLEGELEAAGAEDVRRRTAIETARSPTLTAKPIPFVQGTSTAIQSRETSVLTADLAQLAAVRERLDAEIAERGATKQKLVASIATREKLIALGKERVGMHEFLDQRGAGARALTIEALQQYESQMSLLVGERGQLHETEASLNTLERKHREATITFVADQTQKLAEAEHKLDRLAQELIKARSRNERMRLRAPISGTIQQLAVTTVGQIVSGGQALMTIVPLDGPIEVEAMITNHDIGFVEPGQSTVVKIDAFPFTRYGAVEGSVVKVARDGVDEKDAPNLGDAQSAIGGAGRGVAPSRPQTLVFPATIALKQRTISVEGKQITLLPGMSVSIEIKTGQRRAIDYVLSPLRETTARIGSER